MLNETIPNLCALEKRRMEDYDKNKNRKESYYKSTGKVSMMSTFPKNLSPSLTR